MRRILSAVAALTLAAFVTSVPAQEKTAKSESQTTVVKGYVVDHMCASGMVKLDKEKAMARAKKHTTQCALEDDCAASGYGLVSDGKWIKFDKNGNDEATKYLKSTKRKSGNYVEVSGNMGGEVFAVSSLKPIEDEMPMKGETPMKHDMPMKKDMPKKNM